MSVVVAYHVMMTGVYDVPKLWRANNCFNTCAHWRQCVFLLTSSPLRTAGFRISTVYDQENRSL